MWLLRIFWLCDSERPVGMDIGRVPATRIEAVLREIVGIDDNDERGEYREVLMAVDSAYLEAVRKQRDRKDQKLNTGKRGNAATG